MNLIDVFPNPFKKFLAEFDLPIEEKRATCDDCRMARSAGGFAYKPDLKCCTYFPFLYNFQVGALLTEKQSSPEILDKLRVFVQTEQAQPLGVAPDKAYQNKFLKRGIEHFGRDQELKCPYLDTKNSRCGIWKWRGGVCTSFYCESSFGIKGIEFWRDLEKLFLLIENSIAYDALLTLGFNELEAKACLGALPKSSQKPYRFAENLWQEFSSEREQFYQKTHHHIENMSHQDLQLLLGEENLKIQNDLYKRALELSCQ